MRESGNFNIKVLEGLAALSNLFSEIVDGRRDVSEQRFSNPLVYSNLLHFNLNVEMQILIQQVERWA